MAGNPGPGGWGKDASDTQGGIDTVRVKFTAGAAGAVPSFPLSMSNKVTSVTKSGTTGQYDIVFANKQNQSAGFYGDILQASYSKNGASFVRKVAEDSSAGTCTVQFEDGDGDPVYLASGDIATLVFARQRYRSQ
jgi:hypothetical protein